MAGPDSPNPESSRKSERGHLRSKLAESPGAEEAYDELLEKGREFLTGLTRNSLEDKAGKWGVAPGGLSDDEVRELLFKGFDRELGNRLVLLTTDPAVTFSSTPEERTDRFRKRVEQHGDDVTRVKVDDQELQVPESVVEELTRKAGQVSRTINLRPMDSLESAIEGFDRHEDVRRLRDRLKGLTRALRKHSRDLLSLAK